MTDLALEREAIALFEQLIDLPEGEREGWIEAHAGGRPALLARLRAMQAADRSAAMRTGSAAELLDDEDDSPPERIGAYRIVARIGRGGMGSVYRGERMAGDFDHVVAIKIIKPGLLSERLVERFRIERQTLAQLAHPNIAQLYDGGESGGEAGGGSPYIVMEHVDGLPLLRWAEERALSLAARLDLFADICGAVGFAHRSLVVHRDLTPSNVLVTRDGVVKLIDFGIAKPVDRADGEEPGAKPSIGSLSLTPGYAAPERMTSAEVTTAADIYSLGRLLAKLVPEAMRGARGGELDAILSRATAAEPQDRYPTAEALAADVAAWRGGFPVSVVRRSRGYVARRFVGRHRLGVAAAVAAVLLLVGALAATIHANQRAERERAEAERRFEQTRAIAKEMMFGTYDEVSKASGSTMAREKLVRTGLTYIDALAADATAPIDVKLEAARGYVRLAEVVGGGQAAQLGKLADSAVLLAKAEAILTPLIAAYPDDPAVRRAMAMLRIEQSGTNLYNHNEYDLARRQAAEVQRLIGPMAKDDAELAALVIAAIQAEGDSHGWQDDYAAAAPAHARAEAFFAGLSPAMRREPEVLKARSANLRLLAESYHKTGQAAAARQALDEAVGINEALLAASPDDPMLLRKLAVSLWYQAVVHRTNKRDALALASIDRAVELAERMRQRDPADAGAIQLYALTGEVKAQTLADAGRFADSFAAVDAVFAAHRRLVALADGAPGARRSFAAAMRTGATNFYNGGDYARACSIWGEALAVYADLDRQGALGDLDRKNAVPELKDYFAKSCEGGLPRKGAEPDA